MVCCKRRGEYMSAATTVAHDHDIRPLAGHGKLRVLLVEDNPSDIELVSRELRRGGFDLTMDVVETEEEFTARVRSNSYQVVLADYNLPQWRGPWTCADRPITRPQTPLYVPNSRGAP